jgi:mannose-6-phosphate isomerase-like protein (cupin superfamily)
MELNMSNINYFMGDELNALLKRQYRIYMCGDLERPQEIAECIRDEKLEIGTSLYESFTADTPHYHARATEYNFVVRGCVRVFLYDTKERLEFKEGSLFVLPPGTKYASKSAPGTQVLFIKCPGGNDKTLYDYDDGLRDWLKEWD